MKKFVATILVVVLAVMMNSACCERQHYFRCLDDARVYLPETPDEDGRIGKCFRIDCSGIFREEHAYYTIYRYVEGVDEAEIVWYSYATSGDWMDAMTDCMRQVDFCLEVMDRHGWE